jgi:iron complex outermembrane receptor protein
LGASFVSDNFQQITTTTKSLDYFNSALGIFAQNNLKASDKVIVESGLRFDISDKNNIFILPRLSLLYKINDHLTSRLGGGLGYKTQPSSLKMQKRKHFKTLTHLTSQRLNLKGLQV